MIRQIKSETIKLVSVRGTYAMLAGGLVIAGIGGTVLASPVSEADHPPMHLHPFLGLFVILVGVFAFLLAARATTDEHRYGTIVWTALTQPKERIVVAARALVHGIAGLVFGLLAGLVAVAVVALARGDTPAVPPVDVDGVARVVAGLAVASGLWAMLGSALGGLVRHQVAVVAGGLVWFLFGEQMAGWLLRDGQRFLPGLAGAGLAGAPSEGLVGPAAGVALLAAYVVAAGVAAIVAARARDAV